MMNHDEFSEESGHVALEGFLSRRDLRFAMGAINQWHTFI